ncbi:MAG: 2-oxoacid:acceptor oxidoreductase family protein, partial [Nitrospirota bacterium]
MANPLVCTCLPRKNEAGYYEIRMESIGGLGANLAGKMLAEAGILEQGFNGSAFSSYGSEKKGSPVKAFIRFCDPDADVRINSPIVEPHLLVIFHENLIKIPSTLDVISGKTCLIINTKKSPEDI